MRIAIVSPPWFPVPPTGYGGIDAEATALTRAAGEAVGAYAIQQGTLALSGNYAYLADSGAGLQVIDVSNPANPQRVGGYYTNGFAIGVAVSGNYAYVADYDAGLQVIDVSNPTNCVRVGGYDTSGRACGVAVVGTIANLVNEAIDAKAQLYDLGLTALLAAILAAQAAGDAAPDHVGMLAQIVEDRLRHAERIAEQMLAGV